MGERELWPEWLPSGWSVEVRLKSSGRTYKCYTDPTNDLKFYSKPEVLRHLKNVNPNSSTSKEMKIKSTTKHSKAEYLVKKAVAQGLPPGWIEEMRVRQRSSRKKHVDKYYIEPDNGHVFRSMKQVMQYLESGDRGKSTKSKDKGNATLEASCHTSSVLRNHNLKPVAEGEGMKVSGSKAKDVDKDQELNSVSKGTRKRKNTLPEDEQLEKREKESDFSGVMTVIPSSNMDVLEKVPPVNELVKRVAHTVHKNDQPSFKNGVAVPLRTSKRLAGVEVHQLHLPPVNEVEKQGDGTVLKNDNLSSRNVAAVPLRISKRLAGIGADQLNVPLVNEVEMQEDCTVLKNDQRSVKSEPAVPQRTSIDGEVDQLNEPPVNEVENLGPKNDKPCGKSGASEPRRTSKRLAGVDIDRINEPPVDEVEKSGDLTVLKNDKRSGKRGLAVPQRTSKRLAGVEVDELMELETNSKARLAVVKKSSGTAVDIKKHQNDLNGSATHIKAAQTMNTPDGKQQDKFLLPAGYPKTRAQVVAAKKLSETHLDNNKHHMDLRNSGKHARAAQIATISDVKGEGQVLAPTRHPNSQARPAAGKKLSATDVDDNKHQKDINSSSEHVRAEQTESTSDVMQQGPILLPAGYLPLSQDCVGPSRKAGMCNEDTLGTAWKRDKDVEVPLDSLCKDFLNDPCIEFAIKTLTDAIPLGQDTVHDPASPLSNPNPASSLTLPCGDLWTDPCFAFAVKTLTGEIPLEADSCGKIHFQQPPLGSSEPPRAKKSLSTSVTMKPDSFCLVNHHSFPGIKKW